MENEVRSGDNLLVEDYFYQKWVSSPFELEWWRYQVDKYREAAPEESVQNFRINTWPYTALDVPRLTSEDFAHEFPGRQKQWKELEEQYKSAAKGFSEELAGKEVGRLCSLLMVRARPSGESSPVCVLFYEDTYLYGYNKDNKVIDEFNIPYGLVLTGQFVDMPDGRWHYVYLKENLWLQSSIQYLRFVRPKEPSESNMNDFRDLFKREPTEEEKKGLILNESIFKFGFVREDLIGQIRDENKYFYSQKWLDELEIGVLQDDGTYYNFTAHSPQLYKERPWWIRPDECRDVTNMEIGINKTWNLLKLANGEEKEKLEAMSLPYLFANYPVKQRWGSPVYYKPAGEQAIAHFPTSAGSAARGRLALANKTLHTYTTGRRREILVQYRQRLDNFKELYPGYRNPGYYGYKYEYYENAEKGNSYIYYLLPSHDLSMLIRTGASNTNAYIDDPTLQIKRVNVFPNGGNTKQNDEIRDEIYEELGVDPSTNSKGKTSLNIFDKNMLAGAGALALAVLACRENQ